MLIHALVGEESLNRICELSNGQVLTPGQLIPVLTKADLERVVFDGPSKVIDVGVRQRLFTGATRTAIHARDRGCTHPSCDEPLDHGQIDHTSSPGARAAPPPKPTDKTTAATTTTTTATDHHRRPPDGEPATQPEEATRIAPGIRATSR